MVQLGLGLISIGRSWGVRQTTVPTESSAISFLNSAFNLGIRFFDTAPAYGFSEERLGKWLKALPKAKRGRITIATKFGEFWNFKTNEPFRKYDLSSLKKSVDRSLSLLGEVDILQLHGANLENIKDSEVLKAFDYAKSRGIKKVGVSISQQEALIPAVETKDYQVIQLPHNTTFPNDVNAIKYAQQKKKLVIINRPFAMGKVAEDNKFETKVKAYEFILKDLKKGIILTGTKSKTHLKENINAFDEARERSS